MRRQVCAWSYLSLVVAAWALTGCAGTVRSASAGATEAAIPAATRSALDTLENAETRGRIAALLETPEVHSPATSLRDALEDAFAVNSRLRGYVLDDQGHLRANVVVFVDGVRSDDRIALADPLRPDSRVYVLQALSGG